jgi:phospholipid-binding lipoprotein MlaA
VIALNKVTFAATQAVDRAVIEPAAKAYGKTIPYPIRAGLRHFFTNLTEPVVALNFLLQLKPGKAAETLGRFALNSTVGIGGLLDVAVAKPFKLPYRRNGFANTMAYYGVGPGPFLFVPLVGPTTCAT